MDEEEKKYLKDFVAELSDLFKKYGIDVVFAVDMETGKANLLQMYSFKMLDQNKALLAAYSKEGIEFCPCCKDKECSGGKNETR